jgi:hypothetical protein
MIFAVVGGAQGHGEFVAHLERKAFRLSVAHVMGMGWFAATDDAWLLGHEAEMLL